MKKNLPVSSDVTIIRQAYQSAQSAAEDAVQKAVACGQMLREVKDRLPHGQFLVWLNTNLPEIDRTRAWRWMEAAERMIAASGVDVKLLTLPGETAMTLSQVMSADAASLPEPARHAQQLMLDFMAGKTIKDCLEGVIVEGDDAHRITRAHNGASLGGHRGEDRKAFAEFVGRKLSQMNTHLHSWPSMPAEQKEDIKTKIAAAMAEWPRELIEVARREAAKLLKP